MYKDVNVCRVLTNLQDVTIKFPIPPFLVLSRASGIHVHRNQENNLCHLCVSYGSDCKSILVYLTGNELVTKLCKQAAQT